MRRLSLSLIAMALVLTFSMSPEFAWAHGGQYRGPAGEVPPDSRTPEDPPPPDTPPGTTTPPDSPPGTPTPEPNEPGTPTPDPNKPGTPERPGGDPQAPGGLGKGTPTGRTPRKAPSYESWFFWWNYNKDWILDIRKAVRNGRGASASGIGYLAGGDGGPAEVQNITARTIEAEVVPLLEQFARDPKSNFDIRSAALLGMAKIGRSADIPLFVDLANSGGADRRNNAVEESAALALGILEERSPQVRSALKNIALDGQARIRTRCFAAFALGLLGEKDGARGYAAETASALKTLAATESSRDVACSALVALGLLGDRDSVPDLLDWLNREAAGANRLNDLQLSYVAAALGKIGDAGASGEVVAALRSQVLRKNRLTRYSSVIALGQIGSRADAKVQADCVRILVEVVKSEGKSSVDAQAVNFGLIALGRIAGAGEGSRCPDAVREKALDTLGRVFLEGRPSSRFAALAIGLALRDQNPVLRAPYAEGIRNSLARSTGDAEQSGASCIALGLLRDIQAVGTLRDILKNGKLAPELRGTAAVALGLIEDQGSVDAIRDALMEKEYPKLRIDAAIGAALLRDRRAVDSLVEILKDQKSSQFVLGSVATALGQIGDQRAIRPLASILRNEGSQYHDLTRALAAVALGQIGDKDDVPALARISEDVNYRAYYDAIGEVLTIL